MSLTPLKLFNSVGKFFFQRNHPFVLFLFLLAPLLISFLSLLFQVVEISDLETRFQKGASQEKLALEQKRSKDQFLARYKKTNPHFLRDLQETLFLEKEKKTLESLLLCSISPLGRSLQDRISFISESNRLLFSEENGKSSLKVKETEVKQHDPVQMNSEDLQNILCLIEDVPVGSFRPNPESPQLLVRKLQIKKIENPLHAEVFQVEMDLLKREFQ